MAIHFPHIPATFVHVPKTGGTSFETWVMQNLPKRYKTNTKHDDWDACVRDWEDPGKLIAFCRNPWNRACSMYFWGAYLAQDRINRRARGLKVKATVTEDMDRAIVELFHRGFPAWVRALYDDTDEFQDHFGVDLRPRDPQVSWFSGRQPDIIVRLEHVEQDFQQVQELLGCAQPFPWVNRTEHDNHYSYYDDESRRLVAELFRDDIETFGYEY